MGGTFGSGKTISTSAPVISSLRLQTSCFGRPIPWAFGRPRVAPNLIQYEDFTAIPHTTKQASGGKGGGGPKQANTTYTYTVALVMALASGPVESIGRVWRDKDITSLGTLRLDFYDGGGAQTPYPYFLSRHPSRALAYRGIAYVASGGYDLGDSATIANHSFEVQMPGRISPDVPDANVADVLRTLLTDVEQSIGLPEAAIGDLSAFSNFCLANGIWVSPVYTEQKPVYEHIRTLLQIGFADCVWSGAEFKIVPYSDAPASNSVATYEPNITIAAHLTEDDFLGDAGGDAIRHTRKPQSESFNHVQVQFLDRSNDYNQSLVESKDSADIEQFGLRSMPVVDMPEICDPTTAQKVADFLRDRSLNIRNEYEFTLPWSRVLLEPMDIVMITYPRMEFFDAPMMVISVEEDEDGALLVRVEDYPLGANRASASPPPASGGGYTPDFAVDPGDVTVPVLFEPPYQLTGGRPELWLATAGGANWGGCEVWASTDNISYQRLGRMTGPSRYGSVTALLAAGAAIDTLNVLAVDISASRGVLLGGTEENAIDLVTRCYVGGEYISFAHAALTGVNTYDLTYLVRGAYGTDNAAHAEGSAFVRLDDGIFPFEYPKEWVGKTVWVKLVSFNPFGGGIQDLSGVTAYAHLIEGAPIGIVENLRNATEWVGRDARIVWDILDGADSYDVEVQAGAPVAPVRIMTGIVGNEFYYSADDMQEDGGPWRSVVFRVRGRASTGKTGQWAQVLANNAQVGALGSLAIDAGFQSVVLKCARPSDADFAGLIVWLDPNPLFVPTLESAASIGPGTMAFIGSVGGIPLEQGLTYYLRAAGYDDFGTDALTVSPAIAVTIPHLVATEVGQGVIDESNLADGLRTKIGALNPGASEDALAITQLIANISQDRSARTLARSTTLLQTKVDENVATVEEILESVDGISAQIFLRASVNGKIAGMGIGVNGDTSEVVFIADRFYIAPADNEMASALFTVITVETVINGVTVQPGAYLNAAYINAAVIAEAIVGQAIIDSANIKAAAIGSAHIADLAVTSAKVGDIQSDGYVANVAGWRIRKNGVAEFNGVAIRGDLKAGTININNKFIVAADGTVTIKSAESGERTEIVGPSIRIYDGNNTLRAVLGKRN